MMRPRAYEATFSLCALLDYITAWIPGTDL